MKFKEILYFDDPRKLIRYYSQIYDEGDIDLNSVKDKIILLKDKEFDDNQWEQIKMFKSENRDEYVIELPVLEGRFCVCHNKDIALMICKALLNNESIDLDSYLNRNENNDEV
jgi:hypothetical protein